MNIFMKSLFLISALGIPMQISFGGENANKGELSMTPQINNAPQLVQTKANVNATNVQQVIPQNAANLQQALVDKEAIINNLEGDLFDVTNRLTEAENKILGLDTIIAARGDVIKSLRKQVVDLTAAAKLNTVEPARGDVIKSLRAEIAILKEEVAHLERQLSANGGNMHQNNLPTIDINNLPDYYGGNYSDGTSDYSNNNNNNRNNLDYNNNNWNNNYNLRPASDSNNGAPNQNNNNNNGNYGYNNNNGNNQYPNNNSRNNSKTNRGENNNNRNNMNNNNNPSKDLSDDYSKYDSPDSDTTDYK